MNWSGTLGSQDRELGAEVKIEELHVQVGQHSPFETVVQDLRGSDQHLWSHNITQPVVDEM
jgi:hypothetical protein